MVDTELKRTAEVQLRGSQKKYDYWRLYFRTKIQVK